MQRSGGVLATESKKQWATRVNEFLGRERAKAKGKARPLKDPGLANVHDFLAFDHSLKVVYPDGLKTFLASQPSEALQGGQERFFVPIGSCPPAIQAASGDRTRRACIKNRDGEHVTRSFFQLP